MRMRDFRCFILALRPTIRDLRQGPEIDDERSTFCVRLFGALTSKSDSNVCIFGGRVDQTNDCVSFEIREPCSSLGQQGTAVPCTILVVVLCGLRSLASTSCVVIFSEGAAGWCRAKSCGRAWLVCLSMERTWI